MTVTSESNDFKTFRAWFRDGGGRLHSDIHFVSGPSGHSVIATKDIPADEIIVSCPFNLIITPQISRAALQNLLNVTGLGEIELDTWTEGQLICTYICMHSVLEDLLEGSDVLVHKPYIKILPPPETLRTPLHFNRAELEALRGTNLYGATLERERQRRSEWTVCRDFVTAANARWGSELTWERYLTASTYLASRAFPSTLLSTTPSLRSNSLAYPILLPGVDSLNHARRQPVTWSVEFNKQKDGPSMLDDLSASPNKESITAISLIIHKPMVPGDELLNNYGPKPNSELILGYGFSLPKNPDDTIVLRIGGSSGQVKAQEIGRNAAGADDLWEELLILVPHETDSKFEWMFEKHLDAAEILTDMVQELMERIPPDIWKPEVRPEVALMLGDYFEGQRDILQSLMSYADTKNQAALEEARARGVHIVTEGD